MTIYQEAAKTAEQEFEKRQVEEVKKAMLELLTLQEKKSREIEKLEEERRIIKKDTEDLKEGKLDKIKERLEKSRLARETSPMERFIKDFSNQNLNDLVYRPTKWWCESTSGTYNLNFTDGGNKVFYI